MIDDKYVVFGGDANKGKRYISPTFIDLDSTDHTIMDEEIFGPVLPILSFEKIEEAIALIKNKEKPLALYIFTNYEGYAALLFSSLVSAVGLGLKNGVMNIRIGRRGPESQHSR